MLPTRFASYCKNFNKIKDFCEEKTPQTQIQTGVYGMG